MKDKKRQIILVSLLIISLLLVTLGVSVSLFSYVRKGSTENSVKLGSILLNILKIVILVMEL